MNHDDDEEHKTPNNPAKPGETMRPPRPNWTNPFSSFLEPEKLLFSRELPSHTTKKTKKPPDHATSNLVRNNSGACSPQRRSGTHRHHHHKQQLQKQAVGVSSTMMMMPAAGVSPSGDFDDLDVATPIESTSNGAPPRATSSSSSATTTAAAAAAAGAGDSADRHLHQHTDHGIMVDQHLGPVDRLLLLVADGQSLSRRVLGNERQSARLGERLSALKTPLWQLQARVRTQAEQPPDFIHTLTEEVSHCLDVLLELTNVDWWNQIRRKVRCVVGRALYAYSVHGRGETYS